MNRVSDALRRAGHEDGGSSVVPDDAAFVAGEGGVAEPSSDAVPPDETSTDDVPPTAIRGELVTRDVGLPAVVAPRLDQMRSDSGEDIRLHDVLRLLGRSRWLIAGVVAACLSVAITYNLTATPIYEATARVLIEPTAQQVVPVRSSGEDPTRYDYFVTQIDVLLSRTLKLKTVERFRQLSGEQALPSEQAMRILGSLTVNTSKADSRVLKLSARSTNPKDAARVINTHAQTYIDENRDNLRERSRQASEWLDKRVAELRRDVNSTQSALQTYREQQDAVSLEERQNIVVQKLGQLNASVTTARTELVEKGALYQQLQDLERRNAPLDTFPPIQTNESLQRIRGELEGLRQKRTQLATVFLDEHREMKDVNTAIENLERRLSLETSKIVEGIRTDYRAAQTKEQGLIAALDAQKVEVLDLNKKSIGYSALQRDASSIQQIFEMVMTRLKETELSGELPSNNIRILDTAEVPWEAIWPRTRLNILIALLGGSLLAVGLVFTVEFFRPRLRDRQDVASSLGLRLLGTAPKASKFRKGLTNLDTIPAAFQEAIRHIRAQILLSAGSSSVRTLAITSARPGEGKTVLATSLAISIAMSGRRVLLVDGDLRRAQIADLFGIPRAPGLSNIVVGDIKPSETLVKSPIDGLYILPAGDEARHPGDLLDGERLHQLMSGLRKAFDVVVFDCAPVMAVADAAIIASAATSVVFVVSAGVTSRDVAQQAVMRLEAVQAHILGVVLNNATAASGVEYYPYYAPRDTARSA